MALIFTDGFDHYTDDYLAKKWESLYHPNYTNVVNSPTRSGSAGALEHTVFSAWIQYKNVSKAGTTWFFGFAIRSDSFQLGNSTLFRLYDENDEECLRLSYTSLGKFKLEMMNTPGTYTVGYSDRITLTDQWWYIEIWAHSSFAGNDLVELRINEESTCSVNNRIWWGDGSDPDKYVPNFTSFCLCGISAGKIYYDDVYVCDDLGSDNVTYLGNCTIKTALPNGVGTHSDWVPQGAGDNHVEVDETSPDGDTSYVDSDTPTDQDSYEFTNLSADTGSVRGLAINHCVRDAGTSRTYKPLMRSGGTDYLGPNAVSPEDGEFNIHQEIIEQDPDTASLWAIADINASEFGQELMT